MNTHSKDDLSPQTKCFSDKAIKSPQFISLKRADCGWNAGFLWSPIDPWRHSRRPILRGGGTFFRKLSLRCGGDGILSAHLSQGCAVDRPQGGPNKRSVFPETDGASDI